MLERVIENWLDKASERSFQKPFCYILSNEGYSVVHLSRHCGMEMGKDIIAIAPDGTPCAYQLKSGNITLKMWRQISGQVIDLVMGQIVHSSVDSSKQHCSYLVTNGEIEEEVSRAIDDWNRKWINNGQSHLNLKTVVRGQILEKANRLKADLWPIELTDVKTLLEMFLEDGKGALPKAKLSSLLEATFPLQLGENERKPTKTECERIIASSAVLCAIATSAFSNESNYASEIESWMLYISYVLGFAERWNLPSKLYRNEFEIAMQSIYNSLSDLCDEIRNREHLVEGNSLEDPYFYRVRVTWLVALMSIYALWRLWRRSNGMKVDDIGTDEFIREFCTEKKRKLNLWGEAAIPQFLAFFWYYSKINATPEPDYLLAAIIKHICKQNRQKEKTEHGSGLANPYYEAIEILPYIIGVADEPLMDSFQGRSYALEGLIHLYVRRNWKQLMKSLWPDVTRLSFAAFEPENSWDFYRWRVKNGINKAVLPKHSQEWEELKEISFESEGKCIPQSIKEYPVLLLLFLCVYPHRMNSQIFRWLDTQLEDI